MGGFTLKSNRFTKITGYPELETLQDPGRNLLAVLKVNRAGYVPENVDVRNWIDDWICTAEFSPEVLESLEADDGVISVSISEDLRLIE